MHLTSHDNNVTQFTVKHSSYINATTGYLIERLTSLLIRLRLCQYQARSHTPYSISIHTVWMQLYVMTMKHIRQFALVHVAKCHSTISGILSSYFPMTCFKATVRNRQKTIDTKVPQMGVSRM